MAVIVRVASELKNPWALNPGEIKWLGVLEEAEKRGSSRTPDIWKILENKNDGLPPDQKTAVPNQTSIDFMMNKLKNQGFVTKVQKVSPGARTEVHWQQLPAAKRALKVINQRMSLWGVLLQLMVSGRIQKEEVLKAIQAGYKEGSDEEILGLLEEEAGPMASPPSTNPPGGA
jgi:DNA-binding PadR family transcriptional regulator